MIILTLVFLSENNPRFYMTFVVFIFMAPFDYDTRLVYIDLSYSAMKIVYLRKTKNLLKSHSKVKNVTLLTLLAADKAFSASMATGIVRIFPVFFRTSRVFQREIYSDI